MKTKTLLVFIIGLLSTLTLVLYNSHRNSTILPLKQISSTYPVGSIVSQSVADKPYQDRLFMARRFRWEVGCQITPLAVYKIAGHVLSTKVYEGTKDRGAAYSPLDIALSWGPAATPGVYNLLNPSQGHRFLELDPRGLNQSDFKNYLANIHIVPETDEMKQKLMKVEAGEKIRLGGYLIKIETEAGYSWKSSTVRWDTG